MVFTKLSAQEKEAFFGLLDEYFQSRPEIFSSGHGGDQGLGGVGGGLSTAAATSVVQRALAGSNNLSAAGGGGGGKSNNPYVGNMASNPELSNAVGRVAAASLAFSNSQGSTQAPSSRSDPPSLPNRLANASVPVSLPSRASQEQVVPGAEVDKLVTKKGSVFSAFKKPPPGGTQLPPAFSPPKNTFGPPPVRRTTSTSETSSVTSSSSSTPVPSLPRRQVAPQPQPEPEEIHSEWAEVLYDYSSEDPGDLAIEAGTRVLVTAKSSDDWWTGQIEGQGKEGLFPASYVKLL